MGLRAVITAQVRAKSRIVAMALSRVGLVKSATMASTTERTAAVDLGVLTSSRVVVTPWSMR